MNLQVMVDPQVKAALPGAAYGIITCMLENAPRDEGLWAELQETAAHIRSVYTLDTVRTQPNIAATREAYKALGGDPNRYRPSADALYRRVVKGNELYQISSLVDFVNLVSLRTGFSIGGFDRELISGNVEVGVGRPNEPYEGVGRGEINIAGIPVLRDAMGAFGTPTSDHVRTALRPETSSFYMHIYGYSSREELEKAMYYAVSLLNRYFTSAEISTDILQ